MVFHAVFKSSRQALVMSTIFCFCLINIDAKAQAKIHGIITYKSNQAIPNANMLLLNAKDSSLVKGMITNKGDAYSFDHIRKGKYLILVRIPVVNRHIKTGTNFNMLNEV
jgi:hypothetical protein